MKNVLQLKFHNFYKYAFRSFFYVFCVFNKGGLRNVNGGDLKWTKYQVLNHEWVGKVKMSLTTCGFTVIFPQKIFFLQRQTN